MLYHYTDYIALDGILNNREMWLNNILNMNDAEEMSYFYFELCKVVVDRLNRDGLGEKAAALQKLFNNESVKIFQHSAYAACFSHYYDDAAQWERYGRNGDGVCLGFREDLLRKFARGALGMQDVYYEKDISDHELVNTTYEFAKSCDDFCIENGPVNDMIKDIWKQSAAFKHPSFSSEQEVRLVFYPFLSPDFEVTAHYKIASNRIKKYYPIDLGALCEKNGVSIEDLVTTVCIGPTSTQSISILEDYLYDRGLRKLSKNVHKSDCPLRRPFR